MTSRQLTAVALKVAAIWLLVYVVVSVPVQLPVLMDHARYITHVGSKSGTLSIVFVGLGSAWAIAAFLVWWLWKLARSLGKQVASEEGDRLEVRLTAAAAEEIALRCIGIYLAVTTLPAIAKTLFKASQYWASFSDLSLCEIQTNIELACYFAALVISFLLIAKPKAWVRLFLRLRTAGHLPPPASPDSNTPAGNGD